MAKQKSKQLRKILTTAAILLLATLSTSGGNGQSSLPPDAALPQVTATPFGTASISYPFKLPPGFALQPGLAYNSAGGNGIAGRGWALTGFPIIARDSRYGINYDANDKYISPDGVLIKSAVLYRGKENGQTTYALSGTYGNPAAFKSTGCVLIPHESSCTDLHVRARRRSDFVSSRSWGITRTVMEETVPQAARFL